MKNLTLFLLLFVFLFTSFLLPNIVFAHQPRLIYSQAGNIQISNPEISQAFYDELKGAPRDYYIDFPAQGGPASGGELYLNILVPASVNITGRYSADIFDEQNKKVYSLDGLSIDWKKIFEPFGRDWYMQGPELDQKLPAGKYKIEVYSPLVTSGQATNQGKYVLAVGKVESFDAMSILNIYWQIPLLKFEFFKTSVLQFFLSPFGIAGVGLIGAILIIIAVINYLIGLTKSIIMHNMAKTLLLTSGGMAMREEITKLLQKPAYDVTVAFISTAAKPQENLDYLKKDWDIMRDEMGFNVEEVDIDGKTEAEVKRLLEIKDIIFVEGGNTFYLLKAMQKCNFEKTIKNLLKMGKVYIGASAGSIVAGRTIQTASWCGEENIAGLKNIKGLNLVPFDIFVNYQPENAEIIKQKMKNPKKRDKDLKIITDDQAILVQGKETSLIGKGEAVVI